MVYDMRVDMICLCFGSRSTEKHVECIYPWCHWKAFCEEYRVCLQSWSGSPGDGVQVWGTYMCMQHTIPW